MSFDQVQALINQSSKIAILLAKDFTLDHLCSGLALSEQLNQLGKKTILVSDQPLTNPPRFLPQSVLLQRSLTSYNDLVIRVGNNSAKPGELRYEVKNDGLYIFLKAKEGEFAQSDVAVLGQDFQPDLFIIIGAKDYDQLGRIYQSHPGAFSKTPQIVIHNNPATDRFGIVNIIRVDCASTSEIVMELLPALTSAHYNRPTATYLLAGIIASTDSFTDYLTSPETMVKAARLIELGADKQTIIQNLYKTKTLPALQLWGRLLSRTTETDSGVLYSVIQLSDYQKTQSTPELLPEVFRDLVEMTTGSDTIVVLSEVDGGVRILIASKHHDPATIAKCFSDQSVIPQQLNKFYQYCDLVLANRTLSNALALLPQLPTNQS